MWHRIRTNCIRTNLVKAKIDKSQKDTLFRLCKKGDESVDHIVSVCSKLAQEEYKRRHDKLSKKHWELNRNFEAGDKCYKHEPETVLENEDYKILLDFRMKRRTCKIIDFAVSSWR